MQHDLVRQAKAGDQDAFASLATASAGRLYRVAYRIVRDPDDARDATQQALLEAWRDLSSLRDPERWDAWTYRLLVRACHRSNRRARRIDTVELFGVDQPTTTDMAAGAADRDLLERAFARLSTEQRAIVVLHHHVGLPLTEVATILGIPAGTARSRLHTATHRLRATLEPEPHAAPTPEGHSA